MNWISADEELPNDSEEVIGMREDGWWNKVIWSNTHGWWANNCPQSIVKWFRVIDS